MIQIAFPKSNRRSEKVCLAEDYMVVPRSREEVVGNSLMLLFSWGGKPQPKPTADQMTKMLTDALETEKEHFKRCAEKGGEFHYCLPFFYSSCDYLGGFITDVYDFVQNFRMVKLFIVNLEFSDYKKSYNKISSELWQFGFEVLKYAIRNAHCDGTGSNFIRRFEEFDTFDPLVFERIKRFCQDATEQGYGDNYGKSVTLFHRGRILSQRRDNIMKVTLIPDSEYEEPPVRTRDLLDDYDFDKAIREYISTPNKVRFIYEEKELKVIRLCEYARSVMGIFCDNGGVFIRENTSYNQIITTEYEYFRNLYVPFVKEMEILLGRAWDTDNEMLVLPCDFMDILLRLFPLVSAFNHTKLAFKNRTQYFRCGYLYIAEGHLGYKCTALRFTKQVLSNIQSVLPPFFRLCQLDTGLFIYLDRKAKIPQGMLADAKEFYKVLCHHPSGYTSRMDEYSVVVDPTAIFTGSDITVYPPRDLDYSFDGVLETSQYSLDEENILRTTGVNLQCFLSEEFLELAENDLINIASLLQLGGYSLILYIPSPNYRARRNPWVLHSDRKDWDIDLKLIVWYILLYWYGIYIVGKLGIKRRHRFFLNSALDIYNIANIYLDRFAEFMQRYKTELGDEFKVFCDTVSDADTKTEMPILTLYGLGAKYLWGKGDQD